MNHLKEIKFLPNMSQSPLMVCLKDLGFVDMAQSIALQSPPPAGKIQLFIQNWKVLTSDRWVQDCVQGYAIDWIAQPHQVKPPHEIVFSGEEMNCLSLEVASAGCRNKMTRSCSFPVHGQCMVRWHNDSRRKSHCVLHVLIGDSWLVAGLSLLKDVTTA